MRLSSKGQVTIPAELRRKYGLLPGDNVEFVEDRGTLRIVHGDRTNSLGQRMVERMRGAATKGGSSTDDLMALFRDG